MTTPPPSTLQGRHLEAKLFPSPAHGELAFQSRSRCLIDLGSVLIVLIGSDAEDGRQQDERLAYQRAIYRLDLSDDSNSRITVAFADESQWTKAECESALITQLAAFPHCAIVGVRFPFFDKVTLGRTKMRPCVALYGDPDGPALYLPIYVGAPRSTEANCEPWEFLISGQGGDLSPASAPLHTVDVSKMCGLPNVYHRPGEWFHGDSTWRSFYLDSEHNDREPLTAHQPEVLRNKIVQALTTMLRLNPLSYVDATRELDVGSWIERPVLIDGEWAYQWEQYGVVEPAEQQGVGERGIQVPITPTTTPSRAT